MRENKKEKTQENNSLINILIALFIIIVIVGTSLIITPLGDILHHELSNKELFINFENNSPGNQENKDKLNQNEKFTYTYTIQYNHIGTENNILLDGTVFFSFPMPMIENSPAVNLGPHNHKVENSTIQLIGHYEENGKRVSQVQMVDEKEMKLLKPRKKADIYLPFISKRDNLTPKIMTQSSGDLFTEDFRYGGKGGAIYENESIHIETNFAISSEKADKVTLKNKKGEVSAEIIGTTYSPENGHTHIPIKYSIVATLTQETEEGQKVKKFRFKAEEPIPKDKFVELKRVN